MKWDLIIYENMTESGPCSRREVDTRAVGGSAYAIVQLAEGLAARGKSVMVFSRGATFEKVNGVVYSPAAFGVEDACDVLLVSRKSRPAYHHADRVLISATDVGWGGTHMRGFPIIAVSEWHRRTFLPTDYPDVRVIPAMIDDEAYEIDTSMNPAYARDPNLYVYASAARKGLEPTLEIWQTLKGEARFGLEDARLVVTTPGYDPVDDEMVHKAGAVYIGDLPPKKLQALFRKAAGLFYVNIYPETFCAVAAIAEAAGARTHVLALNDPGALPETLAWPWPGLTCDPEEFAARFVAAHDKGRGQLYGAPHRDFRRSKGLDAWERALWG